MAKYDKRCEHCGRRYVSAAYWSRFCRVACRVKAWRKAQRAK